MKGRKVGVISVSMGIVLVLGFFSSKNISVSPNLNGGLEKYWNEKIVVKNLFEYNFQGIDYKIVLSVNKENEDYKYLNVYEKKLGGVYYECNEASEQGNSKNNIEFSVVETKGKAFTIMYGENKQRYVTSCVIKLYDENLNEFKNTEVNLLEEDKYFIKILDGKFSGVEEVQTINGKDDY
ncbi:MAG: hypothetical protein ACRCYC_04040 [Paraclostridium sp.]|uniref:hypothetical protein n=1 Tax=Paraclostridium sp. TaxID=2023273 RepID=UPI003F2E7DC9